ncbi:hypothetical protein BH10ACT9_BH10ACT9_56920 [soil metagenome]
MVFVDFDGLRSGATTSYTAADRAYDAAGRLTRAGIAAGMFGDFAEAQSFRQALSDAQKRHAELADKNCAALGTIGDNAHRARAGFLDMEQKNTARLDGVC